MIAYERLREIFSVEKIKIDVKADISWLLADSILKHRRLEKYYLWFTTGKVFPEAGQISPALAHNGRMKIMSQ